MSVDINAAIPRLLPIWLISKIENHVDSDKILSELVIWSNSIKDEDAYTGLISVCGLNINRDQFKSRLLPFLFGSGSSDDLDFQLSEKLSAIFPYTISFLKNQALKYAIIKNNKKLSKTWRDGFFAKEIFSIESRIINRTLKNCNCVKFSVYDEIYTTEEHIDTVLVELEKSWNNVCQDTELFAAKCNGVLRFASNCSIVADAPQSQQHIDDFFDSGFTIVGAYQPKSSHCIGGEGGTIISEVFEKVGTKVGTKETSMFVFDDKKIKTGYRNDEPIWRYQIKNKFDKRINQKDCSKEQFVEIIKKEIEKLNSVIESEPEVKTKSQTERSEDC